MEKEYWNGNERIMEKDKWNGPKANGKIKMRFPTKTAMMADTENEWDIDRNGVELKVKDIGFEGINDRKEGTKNGDTYSFCTFPFSATSFSVFSAKWPSTTCSAMSFWSKSISSFFNSSLLGNDDANWLLVFHFLFQSSHFWPCQCLHLSLIMQLLWCSDSPPTYHPLPVLLKQNVCSSHLVDSKGCLESFKIAFDGLLHPNLGNVIEIREGTSFFDQRLLIPVPWGCFTFTAILKTFSSNLASSVSLIPKGSECRDYLSFIYLFRALPHPPSEDVDNVQALSALIQHRLWTRCKIDQFN